MSVDSTFHLGGCALYIVGVANLNIGNEVLESQENINYLNSIHDSVKKTVSILKEAGIEPISQGEAKIGIFFGYGEEDKVYSLTSIIDYLNRCMGQMLPVVKLQKDKPGVIDLGNKE